jgi:acetolactate synthase-1/2/3 large subunit
MKGSEAIAKILHAEDIPFVSAYPGGGMHSPVSTIINESAALGLRTILPRTERGGTNIADGYARTSGKVGVNALTSGPGVENAFAGIAQAYADNSPLLVLAGQARRLRLGAGSPNNDFNALAVYTHITKWAERINYAQRVPEFLRRAFTYLRSSRPGPVFLEMPYEVALETFDDDAYTYRPIRGWRSGGDPRDVEQAVRALVNAKQPMIHAGEGVFYARAWDDLQTFAELLQIPVMTSLKGKGVFPETHPLALGVSGRTVNAAGRYYLGKADVIFAIGASLSRGPGIQIPTGPILIHSTIDEFPINKDYWSDHIILGDAKLVLQQCIAEVRSQVGEQGRQANTSLHEEIARRKADWLESWMPLLTSSEVPINPYRVVWDMVNTIDPATAIATHDAGWPRDQFVPFWTTTQPNGYLGWGHHSTLGFSVAGSIGAKLAEPEKTVVGFVGDGAFGEGGIEFDTAARYQLPILMVITNNSGLGHYSADTPGHWQYAGDYAQIAEGMGGYAEHVEHPDDIIPAIKRALQAMRTGKPALLDVITKLEWSSQTSGPQLK